MTRDEQFRIIDSAKRHILAWAKQAAIPLYAVEYVVPFGETDFGLSAWFFYETKDQLKRAKSTRSSEQLRKIDLGVRSPVGRASFRFADRAQDVGG